MAEGYISIRLVLDNILDHPLLQDMTLERAVNHTVNFMRIVGTPSIFEDKISTIQITNYRGELPEDYYQMIQVRTVKNKVAFRYSTDNFHLSENVDSSKFNELTYKVQGNIIFTSMIEGEIEISYRAILTDEDGFPLIPDNSSFIRALELYIKKQYFTTLFELGKLQLNVLQNVQQEYAWAVGDCQTEFNRLSIDKAESFFNSWKTLILRDNEHKSGFINNGSKERLKLQ